MKVPTYIINLKSRIDRREHILQQFSGRDEFEISIVDAHVHEFGNIGLWNTIRHIVSDLTSQNDEIIIICEDDHLFTKNYSANILESAIAYAKGLNADVLSGGVSWHVDSVQISETLFWIKKFSGTQFLVVFRKFFDCILNASFTEHDTADYKMSSLSDNIYCIYPFISVQKEFGYSDATQMNNGTARVENLFISSAVNAKLYSSVRSFYSKLGRGQRKLDDDVFEDVTIPTYVFSHFYEKSRMLENIGNQFGDKPEFTTTIIEGSRFKGDTGNPLHNFKYVVRDSFDKGEDVIILCDDKHRFTSFYSRDFLLESIFQAHLRGCDILSGGACGFNHAVQITENLFWIDTLVLSEFIIIFKKIFLKILSKTSDSFQSIEHFVSGLTPHKMVLHPFISLPIHIEASSSGDNGETIKFNLGELYEFASNRLLGHSKIFRNG